MSKVLRWVPVLLWCAIIFSLSAIPSVKTPDAPWWEFLVFKGAHVFEYAVLYLLTYRAQKSHVVSGLFVFVYGITDEFHQSFVPGRESSFVRDVGFDMVGGGLAGIFLWKYLPTHLQKHSSSAQS